MSSRSRLVVLGASLYVISDSIISLAAFVFEENKFVVMIDYYLSWLIYFASQNFIVIGVLNSFANLKLEPNPNPKNLRAIVDFLIYAFMIAATIISTRRVVRVMGF